MVFRSLGDLSDGHPNATAIRCKVSLAVLENPLMPPWYLPNELAHFLFAKSHLSAQCQLSLSAQQLLAEESELLWKKEKVVDYIAKDRFGVKAFMSGLGADEDGTRGARDRV